MIDGYFYFPTDNGQNYYDKMTNELFDTTDFQCGIFQHTIVKNIFDSIGVKVEGSLLNDPLYYNTLLNQPTRPVQQYESINNKSKAI